MMDAVVFGRYRLVEQMATSLMSEVWRAHDLELDRPVVLKLLGAEADAERFEREAQAAAGLSHPNICMLYDYGETDGRRFIVFELLPGGSLEDRLADGQPLPDGETARIAGELAAALAYAHAQGVVHRDVKPTNVLFDEDGRAKLADFGVARIADAPTLTEAGTVLGTAAYISPEQATGEPAGPATDVYSFGVLLYRMLTGRLPFESDSALELASMHATREPPTIASLRPDAPPELERLAMWTLAKRPEDRPPDGTALLPELTGGGVDEQTQVLAAGREVEEQTQVLAPAGRRIRRHHVAAGVGLAALAVAGVVVAVLAAPESSQAPVTGPRGTGTATGGTPGGGATTTPPTTSTNATTATTATTGTTSGTTTAPADQPPSPPPPPPTPTAPPTTAPATTAPTTTETTPTTTEPGTTTIDTTTIVGTTTP
jgi:eukaryotic-like serine/threonine-protein kinase